MTIRHSDDSSLQAWGRNLGTIAPALTEVDTTRNKTRETVQATTAAVSKLANQATNGDLPASKRLAAEISDIAAKLRSLDEHDDINDQARRSLTQRAEALTAMYRAEHETDEDRLAGGRGGRSAEKRADVTSAERDT